MNVANENGNYMEAIKNIFRNDVETAHFLWKCRENTVVYMGGRHIIGNDAEDPYEYICRHGLIAPEHLPVFDVFRASVKEGISSGIEHGELPLDVKMRFDENDEFRFCHIYNLFLRDEKGRINEVLVNIRPFTKKEDFDRQILDSFSSDKNPGIYGKIVADLLKNNPDRNIAFIQFDVERFKLINQTYGNETGDELIKFFNDSMHVICTPEQPFCRLTADVFMVVMCFNEKQEILDFIHRIESRLSGYNGMDYRFIFGVSIVDDRSRHTRYYGDLAAMARQSIKGNALQNICFYEERMMSDIRHKQIIEEDMHKAVANDEFAMYLQPKYCISTGRIIGAEALARWIHPQKGLISPAEFVPVFEKNGFIVKLDRIIWEKACRKIRDWIDKGVEPVPISVNISREYLNGDESIKVLKELVAKYDIPIELLELEITESVDSDGVESIVKQFKDNGFTMLMDDFGSGYSSLNMLKTTQFDVLKIDRGFLSEFMESDRGRKIISHTISMSRDIGLDIIAEGVETGDQAKFLYECGCNAAQGFYYSKPVPCDVFDSIFIKSSK
ncbi:MAG: putative bifunctional diguanylate cyclase/phosphodiesterase [Huintestinicola sp.]|uniref:putative bifunctional diguanylate cyclase/phosphodiesterase n=1 Tax=Huintestinicola sp. TaxID=2981661 RepID=UPI003F0D0D7C